MGKKIIFRMILLFILLFQQPLSGKPGENALEKIPEKQKITIFFTNDLQAHLLPDRDGRGGLARIAYIVKEEKKLNPNTILVDAGDMSVGTAFGAETKGEAVFRVMNVAGYDAGTYGNHEFDQWGAEQARRYQEIAKFPLLSCNIYERGGKFFATEYKIFSMKSLRLALTGVTNTNLKEGKSCSNIYDLSLCQPKQEIKRFKEAHSGEYDLLIVISHQGKIKGSFLAREPLGIALIVGGHNEDNFCRQEPSTKTWICQAGHFGHFLGRCELFWNHKTRTVSDIRCETIPITKEIPEDQATKSAIARELEELNKTRNLLRVIGTSETEWNETWTGNWIAELLKSEGKADLGIINTYGVRSGIYPGVITPMDIYEIDPFEDRICVFEIDASEIGKIKSRGQFYFSRANKSAKGKPYKIATVDYICKNDFKKNCSAKNCSQDLLRDKILKKVEKDKGFKYFP